MWIVGNHSWKISYSIKELGIKNMMKETRGGGVLNFGLGRGVPLGFLNATHPCTHFEGKVTHPCTKNQNFSLKFAPFWRKILKSWPIKVPNLRHFGANFRKFWKIDPSKYHVFEKKGPIDVPGCLILLPMFAAHPYNHFCTEYPPGERNVIYTTQ